MVDNIRPFVTSSVVVKPSVDDSVGKMADGCTLLSWELTADVMKGRPGVDDWWLCLTVVEGSCKEHGPL